MKDNTTDQLPEDRWEGRTAKGDRLFTFGLRYPHGDLEEIDVFAEDAREARRRALLVAEADYEPGWTFEELPPGGSGGLVEIWSL